ncbi:uncharacterized protein A4U43_C01F8180 [Asparagus officinalis]|uniref:VHS domain-containing protein n=1 Tax=Asparagus officinalis TaxID=4686 RepID=A0A5P1FMU2_ASPOF|nr:target of Myb protein 1 [Asparagus officinalis]XP_020277310.1 target of Myb protein 1 [Asparagus officinalis]XP_020277319.1 target of Myb protein 1 [Asparagus officinalis]ONK79616.1 uncharacterized protein A4U43_C01F8180 [Asparagus officinalis]
MDKMKLAALGERLKIGGERLKTGGAEIGKKVSGKMKEILQGPSQEAKMVDEATADSLEEPNWGLNLRICNLLNSEEFDGMEVVRAIKKKISSSNDVSQRLSLDLLETCAMNCDKVFSEVASEKVLDEMVKMIENPQMLYANRRRAMQLIEAWGKSEDLAYLPVFRQTYMSIKDRKLPSRVPGNGNSTSAFSSVEPGMDEHEAGFPDGYPFPTSDNQDTDFAYHGTALSVEEKKEFLVITRNSVDILSSMLNAETDKKPVKDDLMLSMVEKCKESEPIIQRVIESIDGDESLLFEALSLHDELQQVLSKYQELDLSDQTVDDSCIAPDASTSDEKKS